MLSFPLILDHTARLVYRERSSQCESRRSISLLGSQPVGIQLGTQEVQSSDIVLKPGHGSVPICLNLDIDSLIGQRIIES